MTIQELQRCKYSHAAPLQRVTSLRRCAQANAPAASNWLRRVLDDGGRRARDESIVLRRAWGRNMQCTSALFKRRTINKLEYMHTYLLT